jgi:probable F420-dependent oxidoreductase
VKFGVAVFPTDYAISMTELAPSAEELGFESLWVAEHTHIPTSRESPWPAGGDLPKHYWHTMDPFVALTAAAMASKTIKVATGICLLIERDPIHTAKETASLDLLSGGRFLFGIGGGWNREEMAGHGTDFSTRWKLLRERTEAVKAIWTNDIAEYHGEFVDFGPMWSYPKPLQKPHPPVILGGGAKNVLQRVVAWGDGWLPNRITPDELRDRRATLDRLAKDAGRDPAALTISVYGQPADRDLIRRLIDAGANRVVVRPATVKTEAEMGAELTRIAEAVLR